MEESCSGSCGGWLGKLAMFLLVVGGLNWGLVGVMTVASLTTNLNLVNLAFGSWPMVEGVVYLLVGLSAVYLAVASLAGCKKSA